MAGQLNIGGRVREYFLLESPLCATLAAEAFKAVDKSRNRSVCLWIGRRPLDPRRETPEFLIRMQALTHMEMPPARVLSYGLDSEDVPFICLEHLDGSPLRSGRLDIGPAERRFIATVRLVERLHDAGIVCGDLCASSFWYQSDGEILFIGLVGLPTHFSTADVPERAGEYLPYLAPELRSQLADPAGEGGSLIKVPASDVFSLGVLGYYLLSGLLPWGDRHAEIPGDLPSAPAESILAVVPKAPAWAGEVLEKCLVLNPRQRYANAGALFKAVMNFREGASNAAAVPALLTRPSVASDVAGAGDVRLFPSHSPDAIKAREAAKAETERKLAERHKTKNAVAAVVRNRVPIAVAGGAVALISCGLLLLRGGHESNTRLHEDLEVHRSAAATAELKKAIDGIGKVDSSFSEKENSFQSLIVSGDPLAHAVLLKSALDADSDRLRRAAENALVERAQRHALNKSAETVRGWLAALPRDPLPKNYENILKCLDASMPPAERDPALEAAFAEVPSVTIRLTAALALDTGRFDDFDAPLTKMVEQSFGLKIEGKHSTLALILLHPELSVAFGNDVLQNSERIPKEDLRWLIEEAQNHSSDVNIPAIAGLAIKAGIFDPIHTVFLEPLRDKPRLPAPVVAALLHLSVGEVRREDYTALANWYEPESEKVLLALCAGATDRASQKEVFDVLTSRPLRSEPAASLVDWVKAHYWEKRGELVHAIGVLSNEAVLPPDVVKDSFAAFDPLVRDSTLIPVFLASNNPGILRLALERYGQFVGASSVLKLLDHPDKAVRIQAVKSLARTDSVDVLKEAVEKSKKEKDPAVKQAYQDIFYIIKNRSAQQQN